MATKGTGNFTSELSSSANNNTYYYCRYIDDRDDRKYNQSKYSERLVFLLGP